MWMDLIHCINIDGWSVQTKQDVVNWCLNRLDEWHLPQLSFSRLISDVQNNIWRYNVHRTDGKTLSYDDAIIWAFYSYVSVLEGKHFNEGVKPSNDVLPLGLHKAYYYPDISNEYHFAEMMCDRLSEINKMFPDYPEQKISDWNTFERIESMIEGKDKDWHNVVVLIGSDSLLDCKEIEVTGELLNNSGNITFDGDNYLELGIYEHCKFDKDKSYIVRYKEIIHDGNGEWDKDWIYSTYIIKSIKEL